MPTRQVYCKDALSWIRNQNSSEDFSWVASLPDKSEFSQLSLAAWKAWFTESARLICASCPSEGVAVFLQSDIKFENEWVDKAYLCHKGAEEGGLKLVFHKIICRAPAGVNAFGRPAYSHLLAFSQAPKLSPPSPDVFANAGDKTWARGMGLQVALFIARFIREATSSRGVINPFCGQGSMLAAANHVGLDAIGIERSVKRAEMSRRVQIDEVKGTFVFEKDGPGGA